MCLSKLLFVEKIRRFGKLQERPFALEIMFFKQAMRTWTALLLGLMVAFSCAKAAPVDPSARLLEEECGDGYTCTVDGQAYGCVAIGAPRGTPMVCCSAGMPEEACNSTSSPLRPLPYCPYGGATGGGCIRLHGHKADTGTVPNVRVDDSECGDDYTCAHDGDAYGCAKANAPIGTPMVCCSSGQTVAECNTTSSPLHPLPFCPSGGATGAGCIRASVNNGRRSDTMETSDSLQEECGDGYACTHDGDAYGCAKMNAARGTPMVCCSAGQDVAGCNSTSSPLHPLPFCPYGGATGSGCVRESRAMNYEMGTDTAAAASVDFEEECGDGYSCAIDGQAYGCMAIGAPRGTPMVCCSVGQPVTDCNATSSPLHPLPFCPYGGATGEGCVRERGASDNAKHTDSAAAAAPAAELLEEECGEGYRCTVDGSAYGCVAMDAPRGSPMVCCSAGMSEEICNNTTSPLHPLPYCPYGGATGGGCIRVQAIEEDAGEVLQEECGDGYTCSHDGGAYGCAKLNAPPGTPMVCCSTGQSVADCDSTSSPLHPLPYCPYAGATGEGCVRESHASSIERRIDSADPFADFEESCGPGYRCSTDGITGAYGCVPLDAPMLAPMTCCSEDMSYDVCFNTTSPLRPLPYCPYAGATGPGCIRRRASKESRPQDAVQEQRLK